MDTPTKKTPCECEKGDEGDLSKHLPKNCEDHQQIYSILYPTLQKAPNLSTLLVQSF